MTVEDAEGDGVQGSSADPSVDAAVEAKLASLDVAAKRGAQQADEVEDKDARIGLILSSWRLDAPIGIGRMATVYAASNQAKEHAAVKVMHPAFKGDERVRRRIFREANIARKLEHPSVTRVLVNDVTPAGDPYIVMERFYGRDLGRLLELYERRFPVTVALLIALELLEFLEYAHTQGIVHRNLAPFNVYLTHLGEVKVFDCGSAWSRDDDGDQSLEALGANLHGYRAPELVQGEAGDQRADVYSIGALLFTLISGLPIADPLTADDAEPSERGVPYEATPCDIRAHRASIAEVVADVVDRSFTTQPVDRYNTAAAMRRQIVAIFESQGSPLGTDAEARRAALSKVIGSFYDSREELEREETGAWRSAGILRDLFRLVENVLSSGRRFGWEHGETQVRLEYLVDQILGAISEDPDGIFWIVRPYSFEYRGDAIWTPANPFDKVTYNLFDAGFRKMHLLPDLDDEECRRFLRWLTLDPDDDLPTEDDLATAFWAEEFENVTCELVSAVVLQDVEDYEQLDRELEEMHTDAIEQLRGAIARKLSGAYDIVHESREDGDDKDLAELLVVTRPSLLNLSPKLLAGLGESAARDIPMWRGKLAELLARAHQDAKRNGDLRRLVEPFAQFVKGAVEDGAIFDALEVYGEFAERIDDPNDRRELIAPFIDGDRLRRVIAAIIPYGEPLYFGERTEFVATRLATLLMDTPGDRMPTVIEALGRCRDRTLLAVLLDFCQRHAGGHEHPLGELLRSTQPLVGTNIVKILAENPSRDAIEALGFAMESRHAKIRIAASEVLARYAPQRAIRELRRFIRDEEGPIRIRALEAIRTHRLDAAVDDLLERAEERSFQDAPRPEKKLLLSTACELSEADGERKLIELVNHHGIVQNDEIDETRKLAVEILRELALTDDALEAVRGAAKRRWWNSRELQGAAEQAASEIEHRLRDLDAELGERVLAPSEEDN